MDNPTFKLLATQIELFVKKYNKLSQEINNLNEQYNILLNRYGELNPSYEYENMYGGEIDLSTLVQDANRKIEAFLKE